MFPTLFSANGIELHTWGLMVVTAFLAASLVASVRAPRVGIEPDKLVPMYLLVTFAGLVGARLLHFAMADDPPRGGLLAAFFDMGQGGYAFYGGAIGGILSGALYAAARGIPVLKLADVTAPTILLGQAIGRLGCFLAGCCHGAACPLPESGVLLGLPHGRIISVDGPPFVALVFSSGPGEGVASLMDTPLYPTQLWEAAGTATLFVLLSWMWKHARRFDGQILAAMLVLYAGLRASIESFRGDDIRGFHQLAGVTLSTSQAVALFMAGAGLLVALVGLKRGRSPEQVIRPEEADDL